jgi:hypothetical protein
MKKTHYLFFFLLLILSLSVSQNSNAQDITDKESQLVTKKSTEILLEFNQLLNLLISPDNDEQTIKELIANSFRKDDANQIFFNEKVIFEDDINPNHFDYKTASDATLGTYLKNIDLFLEKSNTTTVVFSDIQASNVKLGEYLYVKVFFKSLFKGKNKGIATPYRTTNRVAEIRAEYVNDKWKFYIMRISFVTPDDLANPYKNDLDIVETARIGARKMDVSTLLKEKEKRKAMEEERKVTIMFQKSINSGDSAVKVQNYDLALKSYQKAKEILPTEKVIVDKKIQNTQLLQEANRLALAKKKAEQEDQQRLIAAKKKADEELQQKALAEKQRVEKEETDKKLALEKLKIEEAQKIANDKKRAEDEAIELQKKLLLEEQQKVSSVKPIPNVIQQNSNYKPLLGIKILAAAVGVFGAYNAYSLKNDYDTKLTALKNASAFADPDGDGNIRTPALYSSWKTAYDDAQTAKGKQGTITASMGIAAVAVVVETLLMIRKKPIYSKGMSFKSNSQNIGIAFNYNF